VDCRNKERVYGAIELFQESGATPRVNEYESGANIAASLEGSSDDLVVIGAHYDKTTLGCGAIDNWTGVVLLNRLYRELKNEKLIKDYEFVAFGEEEKGLLGSMAMTRTYSEYGKKKPCAMINLDSFGFDRIWALESISDRSLLTIASDVGRQRGDSFSIRNYRGASSDSESFRQIGVPSITFSGINNDWRDYLHKEQDQIENIDVRKVAENQTFLRDFVGTIDRVSCKSLAAEKKAK
jgi:Iap family predicted aminopeptidase